MPRRILLTTKELANQLGTTDRNVRKLKAEGVLIAARDDDGKELLGRFELRPNAKAYVAYKLEQRQGDSVGESDLYKLRCRKLLAEAKTAEIQLRLLEGNVHLSSDVIFIWTNRITAAKSELMGIPSRLHRELAAEDDPQKVYAILSGAIEEALFKVSEIREKDFVRQSERYLRNISDDNGAPRAIPGKRKKVR